LPFRASVLNARTNSQKPAEKKKGEAKAGLEPHKRPSSGEKSQRGRGVNVKTKPKKKRTVDEGAQPLLCCGNHGLTRDGRGETEPWTKGTPRNRRDVFGGGGTSKGRE